MGFVEEIRKLSNDVITYQKQNLICNEEATKRFIIIPLLRILGYNVDNPLVFRPEYTADYEEIKNNEKVDYAIFENNTPIIFIEAKSIEEDLKKHSGQLKRYFGAVTEAKLGILTNGIEYKFYTDLNEKNSMDKAPFFVFNLLQLKDASIAELEAFCSSKLKIDEIQNRANKLKFIQATKLFMTQQMEEPSDEFVKLILKDYFSVLRVKTIERYRATIKKSLSQYIWDLVDDKLESMKEKRKTELLDEDKDIEIISEPQIETTEDELKLLTILRTLFKDFINPERIGIKDTRSYCNYIIDEKTRNWICRLKLGTRKQTITVPVGKSDSETYEIKNIFDVNDYRDKILDALKLIMNQ